MKLPWTPEELADLRAQLETSIAATEEENPEIRPLPAMQEEVARDMLLALTDAAKVRTLTGPEAFMIGQLLQVFRMAVEARMLNRRGRYFVFSQDDVDRLMKEGRKEHTH